MQLMPSTFDVDGMRAALEDTTPEERVAAAQRYLKARYAGEIYDPETDSWALPPDK